MRLVNATLIDTYWQVGAYISRRIAKAEWGDSVVKELAAYIQRTLPELKGFSNKNLWRMKQFYEAYAQAPENDLRRALIHKMKNFLLEIGSDFLFMGEEYRLQVGMSDFRIDLLFFHRELQLPDKQLLQQKLREIFDEHLAAEESDE